MTTEYTTQADYMREHEADSPLLEQFDFLRTHVDARNPTREQLSSRLDNVPPGDEDTVLACALHLSPIDYEGLVEKAKRVHKSKPKGRKTRRRR